MEREIERMKREHLEMDKEIQGMARRLETTERRPEQMMAFLCKVVEDPDILQKMMVERDRRTRRRQICSDGEEKEKRRRLTMTPPSSNSGRTTTEEEEEGSSSLGVMSSSPELELMCQFAGGGISMEGEVSRGFLCDAPPVGLEAEALVPPYPFSLLGGGF